MYAEEERSWEQEFKKTHEKAKDDSTSEWKPTYSHDEPQSDEEEELSKAPWEISYSTYSPTGISKSWRSSPVRGKSQEKQQVRCIVFYKRDCQTVCKNYHF